MNPRRRIVLLEPTIGMLAARQRNVHCACAATLDKAQEDARLRSSRLRLAYRYREVLLAMGASHRDTPSRPRAVVFHLQIKRHELSELQGLLRSAEQTALVVVLSMVSPDQIEKVLYHCAPHPSACES
jgi:hypothetical protein